MSSLSIPLGFNSRGSGLLVPHKSVCINLLGLNGVDLDKAGIECDEIEWNCTGSSGSYDAMPYHAVPCGIVSYRVVSPPAVDHPRLHTTKLDVSLGFVSSCHDNLQGVKNNDNNHKR